MRIHQQQAPAAAQAASVPSAMPRAAANTAPCPFDLSRIPLHPPAAATLFRDAAGAAPALAPGLVHEVLRGSGQPLPAKVRSDAEARFGRSFGDVRIHTDARAGASAQAVAANAYTVGRQIVFAPGRFAPASEEGKRLLTHELSHAAAHRPGTATPSGALRISDPGEPAERHASALAQGSASAASLPQAAPGLFRDPAPPVQITGADVTPDVVTVPIAPGQMLRAGTTPANATGVSYALAAGSATLAAGTRINPATGAITVAVGQTGGNATVTVTQTIPVANASPTVVTVPVPIYFAAIPGAITRTVAAPTSEADVYGGDFIHTFAAPAGGQATLEEARINERFAGSSGTSVVVSGGLGSFTIHINDPVDLGAGWKLDATGAMTTVDSVTWNKTTDARPFVANASNPAPATPLPQTASAVQSFHTLRLPQNTWGANAIARTTHRRAYEDRSGVITAVTSAAVSGNMPEVAEAYAGPTVFRRCTAAPATIPVSTATSPSTSTISVVAQGAATTAAFSIVGPDLGCTISAAGVLSAGTTAGSVRVRAGDSVNFDETTVVLTARAAQAAPGTQPVAPMPGP